MSMINKRVTGDKNPANPQDKPMQMKEGSDEELWN